MIGVFSGSPADRAIQEPVARALAARGHDVRWLHSHTGQAHPEFARGDIHSSLRAVVICGDREDALLAAIDAHRNRVPIVHVAAGDTTHPVYVDSRFRDAISALADVLCTTHTAATVRLTASPHLRGRRIVQTGLPSLDAAYAFARTGADRRVRGGVLIAMHPEPWRTDYATIIGTISEAVRGIGGPWRWIEPNGDDGGAMARALLTAKVDTLPRMDPQAWFRWLTQSSVVVGNSSSLVYDCSMLGVPSVVIGERQKGRTRCVPLDANKVRAAMHAAGAVRQRRGLRPSTKYGDGTSAARVAREAVRLAARSQAPRRWPSR